MNPCATGAGEGRYGLKTHVQVNPATLASWIVPPTGAFANVRPLLAFPPELDVPLPQAAATVPAPSMRASSLKRLIVVSFHSRWRVGYDRIRSSSWIRQLWREK